MPLEVRDVLMSWTIVASSLLESGGGVESKTMARHVGWWTLLGLVRALGRGAVVMGWIAFWLVSTPRFSPLRCHVFLCVQSSLAGCSECGSGVFGCVR